MKIICSSKEESGYHHHFKPIFVNYENQILDMIVLHITTLLQNWEEAEYKWTISNGLFFYSIECLEGLFIWVSPLGVMQPSKYKSKGVIFGALLSVQKVIASLTTA